MRNLFLIVTLAIFKYDSKTKNVGDFLTSYYSSNGSISESLIFKISKDKSERTDLKIVVIANAAASVSKYDLVSAGKISYADLRVRPWLRLLVLL